MESIAALNAITRDVETGATDMKASAASAVDACRRLTELSRSVDDRVAKCDDGAKSLGVNSELVVRAAKHAKIGVEELEDSVSSFKVRPDA